MLIAFSFVSIYCISLTRKVPHGHLAVTLKLFKIYQNNSELVIFIIHCASLKCFVDEFMLVIDHLFQFSF